MEGLIHSVMKLLTTLVGIYSLLIIIRIMLTWFSNAPYGRPVEILAAITDPYLDWWRQRLNLRAGTLDLSPIVAMAALSVVQTICSTMADQGRISLGIILAVCLSALWSAVSFILGFCVIVLVLRFIGYMCNTNMYSVFWRIIDSISQPLQ
jgi:YggT family protein